MIERTAIKILPILKELGHRLAGAQKKGIPIFSSDVDKDGFHHASTDKERMQLRKDINEKLGKKGKGMLFDNSDEDEKPEIGDAEIEVSKKKLAENSSQQQKPEE